MCQKTPGFRWVELSDLTYIVCDIPTSIYNRIINTRLDPRDVDTKIKDVEDYYSSKGLPFLWMVSPRDTPPNLSQRLEESGFVRSGSPGMAIDLRRLKEPESPPGFRLKKVQDEESLTDYSQLMPRAFGFDELSRKAVSGWIRGVGLHENLSHYIGYLDDDPVTFSSVFCADGVAGLYCVASTPEARGRGLGSLTSTVPLLAARGEGYRVGVLHSTMMAHGVYLRLGFKDYCEIVNYSRSESGDSYLQTLSRQR